MRLVERPPLEPGEPLVHDRAAPSVLLETVVLAESAQRSSRRP